MIRNQIFIAVLSRIVTDAAFSNVRIFDPQRNVVLFIDQLGRRPGGTP
jgi:hypothetical protein